MPIWVYFIVILVCFMQKLLLIALLLLCSECSFWRIDKPVDFRTQPLKKTVAYNKANYPLTIVNYNSKAEEESFTYEKSPQRVIAIWQNSVEIMLALGLEDRLIAGLGVPTDECLLPAHRDAYNKLPYKSLELLDLETVMMMQPDMIIGWYSTFSQNVLRGTDFWKQRGVHTYIAKSSSPNKEDRVLESEYQYILDIGRIFDREARAQEIVNNMQQEIAYVVDKTKHIEHRPSALVIELMGNNVSIYGDKTLAGDIVHKLRGNLLLGDARTISMEQIIDLNPDNIFVVITERYHGYEQMHVDKILHNKALQNLDCIKNKRVFPLPLYAIYASGIRSYDGIQILARGLYPELYEEKNYE